MNQGIQPDTEWEEDTGNTEDTGGGEDTGNIFDPEVTQYRMLQKYLSTKKLWFKWPEFAGGGLQVYLEAYPEP